MAFETFIGKHWNQSIPVNLVQFARSVNIEILPAMGVQYVVAIDYDSRTLHVNVDEPSIRKRFAVAHAIGHFALGHLKAGESHADHPASYDNRHARYVDRQANAFALELLMPDRNLLEAIEAGSDEASLCKQFLVSSKALSARIKMIGCEAAVLRPVKCERKMQA